MADVDEQVEVEQKERDPERDARRRIALAQIRQYPDVALKMKARPVEEFDDELRRLAERMKLLMADASGIGLAATQVGVLQRLFVFHVGEDEVVAVANPEIVERGEETDVDDRAASIRASSSVERANSTLAGRDENGAEVRYGLEDIYARAQLGATISTASDPRPDDARGAARALSVTPSHRPGLTWPAGSPSRRRSPAPPSSRSSPRSTTSRSAHAAGQAARTDKARCAAREGLPNGSASLWRSRPRSTDDRPRRRHRDRLRLRAADPGLAARSRCGSTSTRRCCRAGAAPRRSSAR
jgi:peptide deformylase